MTVPATSPEPAPELRVCGYEATGEPIGPHDDTGQGRCGCEPAPARVADTGEAAIAPSLGDAGSSRGTTDTGEAAACPWKFDTGPAVVECSRPAGHPWVHRN